MKIVSVIPNLGKGLIREPPLSMNNSRSYGASHNRHIDIIILHHYYVIPETGFIILQGYARA